MKPSNTPLATAITTTAASTAALFALQHHADAAIIYSGTENYILTLRTQVHTGDAVLTSVIGGAQLELAIYDVKFLMHTAAARIGFSSGASRMLLNASNGVKKLAAGAVISAAQFPGHNGLLSAPLREFKNGVVTAGTWLSNQPGFAAFQLANGDLGWIRLEWTTNSFNSPFPGVIEVVDIAYDNVPGEAIQAGQTSSVPEPGTTALLALAGAGAALARRKRTKSKA